MELHQNGSLGVMIRERNDKEGFDVYFLYNVSDTSTGDVFDRKTFKRWGMVQKRTSEYLLQDKEYKLCG